MWGSASRGFICDSYSTCLILNAANIEIETARFIRTPCHRIAALRFLRAIYRQVYYTTYLYRYGNAIVFVLILTIFAHVLSNQVFQGRGMHLENTRSYSELIGRRQNSTRSSAIAEGPRDASCQLKSCQLRDRQCALNHDAIESAPIVSSVINKPTTLSCVYHLSTDDLLWRNFLSPQCRNCSRDPDHAHFGSTHSSQD